MSKSYEAKYYITIENDRVQCKLCPHNCIIPPGETGTCNVRRNIDNKLISEIYGEVSSISMDPIEKKPLYHFYPGSQILSIGTRGCNMKCPYCQNWHISQDSNVHTSFHSYDKIVKLALNNKSVGIAYTYSEPIIWFEYILDTAALGREKGLKNVLVTNGYINDEPLRELIQYVDAVNIDLKSYREQTYKKIQKGNLADVKNTIEVSHNMGISIEITTLIVTGLNDDLDEMKDIINYISSVDRDIPWHISRYFPNYNYNKPATDIKFIYKVYEEALKKLNFVYCGNIPSGDAGNNTICPSCSKKVISRSGYSTTIDSLNNGKCGECGTDLKIIH
ncbi:AmmeMemoRadiSam system radical SAM enzyme [Spirochaetota bacterium]